MEVRTKTSEYIGELAKALIKFQQLGIKIPKSSRNPFLKSKYADLSTILDHVQKPLADNGLTIVQAPVGEHELTTVLLHESGEFMASTYKMQPLESVIDKDTKARAITPQSIGSVITYQRRYAIGAMLNLNIDDDVDGNPPNAGELADAASAPAAPKKTAAEIKAELLAKQAAATVATSNTGAQPGVGNSDSASPSIPPLVVDPVPENAKTVEMSTDKCSEADVAEIKRQINIMEQVQQGFAADFKARLLASGRKAIADLTVAEASLLKQAIETKTVAAFFDQSMAKSTP